MKGIREIRRRIKAVKNTAQITKAMQLVASSKMKRAQDAALASRPYALLLSQILESALPRMHETEHPFFAARSVKKRGILVISTDKGLCGALNGNLFRLITDIKSQDAAYVCVGRKGAQFVARTGRELLAEFPVSDKVGYNEVRPVVEFLTQAYLDGKVDTIEVIYAHFVNTLRQDPALAPMVPFQSFEKELEKLISHLGKHAEDKIADDREIQFEPSVSAIINELPPLFLKQQIYTMILAAKASEHSARMVAMKNASDNAKQLVADLSLEYNKARQAGITQEILEIAAAASAN
ncbi:MAG TPA: ATP synthase F1 subunit gamma [Opitutales bacterium]|nr:ATP synthase F1 subunit gamma [Opitutales bacterium]